MSGPGTDADPGDARADGTRILVIDDEASIRRFLRISLESVGYEVLDAIDGGSGLARIRDDVPQLIVLDLGLPDMDGSEVLSALREDHSTPVIILSVRHDEDEKVRLLDGGANDYVTKPFGIREFLARIRALLRDHPDESDSLYDDGHLHFDPQAHEVTLDGARLELTPKEFAVLQMLVAERGRVVTGTRMLREIWGPTHIDHSHYLRVIVARLRQKLDDDALAPRYIETHARVGYRFVGDTPAEGDRLPPSSTPNSSAIDGELDDRSPS